MKKEIKINGNKNNLKYKKLKYCSNKISLNLPILKIVVKKDINSYINNKHNSIYSRNKFNSQLTDYITYSKTSNIDFTTSQRKNKNLKTSKIFRLSSPTNIPKFKSKNFFINRNLTEGRINNKHKILKKNSSQSPNTLNLLDSKNNYNTIYLYNNNYDINIFNKSNILNANEKANNININNYKRTIIKNINEKYNEKYANKKNWVINNEYSNYEKNNFNKNLENHKLILSHNIYEDLTLYKIIKKQNFQSLNNDKNKDKNIIYKKINKINKNKFKKDKKDNLRDSYDLNLLLPKSIEEKNRLSHKNNNLRDYNNHNYKYLDSINNSVSFSDFYPKSNTSRDNNNRNSSLQPYEDIEKIKQSYNNLEKINNKLNLLNKNLISENNKLKLQIINISTNIYNNNNNNNSSNEKSDKNINKTNIQQLKNKIIKLSEENEILKNNNNKANDILLISKFNKAMEDSEKLKLNIKRNNIQVKENKKLKEKNEEISKEIEKLKNIENKYNSLYLNNYKLHKKYNALKKNSETIKHKNSVLVNKIKDLSENMKNKINIINDMNNNIDIINKDKSEKENIIKDLQRKNRVLENENDFLFKYKSKYNEIEIENLELKNKITKPDIIPYGKI